MQTPDSDHATARSGNDATARHTEGPWRWELNEKHRSVQLVGGRPMYDLTIIQPIRWGLGGATLFIRDTAHDGMNLMHKLHERRDWIAPHHGRAHHASWCADVVHPDMRLMAASPLLLAALNRTLNWLASYPGGGTLGPDGPYEQARAAIAAATGTPTTE